MSRLCSRVRRLLPLPCNRTGASSGFNRNLAVHFGDVCHKRERLLALSRFLRMTRLRSAAIGARS